MVNLAIFDYGAGNIFSLKNSLEQAGASVDVITSFDKPNVYSGLLLPGVGNFDPAIQSINENSKTKFHDYVKDETPVLGICLGMEMFFEKSEEGVEKGFNVIDGEIVVLPSTMKVPHMGWNSINVAHHSPMLNDIATEAYVYFVHSYYVEPVETKIICTETTYGVPFVSSVAYENVFACQFHPEKSQRIGLQLLRNFGALN